MFTPSNASSLNWIESEFTALRYFAVDGTDYRSHAEQDNAVGRYIRWRHHRCHAKRPFASVPRSANPITYPQVCLIRH